MRREISKRLFAWKAEKKRKVLLVRGARQVGKTYSVRNLGRTFDHYLEVNLEEDTAIHAFFEETLTPQTICENLSAYYGMRVIPGKTLLFFDEIQACVRAIQSLRFFYEKMPDLHVLAAGSLLEFALSELPTFGVGRIQSLFMYPLSFEEFLLANDEDLLSAKLQAATPQLPLPSPIHDKLVFYLRKFLLIGGLPEVVKTYIETKRLADCQVVLDNLLTSFYDDFSKYKKRVPVSRIREVFDSVVFQSGEKFKMVKASPNANIVQTKEALELLLMAGMAYKIYHTSANGLPLGAEVNPKKFKVILFDTGLQQRILNLDIHQQLIYDDFETINKGSIAEQFVGLELCKLYSFSIRPQIFYWHRESKSSNAEIDYLIQMGRNILPIEVKAGTKGQMQSMFIFLKEKKMSLGIRQSLENFSSYPPIEVYPLYAVKNIYNNMNKAVD